MLIGLSTAVTYCDVITHQAGHVESLGLLMLSTLAHARVFTPESLALGGKPQYVTAVDKPINMPRISWQACTKRSINGSIQFDQTLSLLRESWHAGETKYTPYV